MASPAISPLSSDELLSQAAELRSAAQEAAKDNNFDKAAELTRQAENLEQQIANLEPPETPTTPTPPVTPQPTPRFPFPAVHETDDPRTENNNKWRVIVLVSVAVLLVFFFFTVGPYRLRSNKEPAISPTQTKQTVATSVQATPSATEPAKPLPVKPSVELATKKMASKTTTTASSLSFVSEIQKLRSEIEGLKGRLSATPVSPTINFPPEITVRLVPSQEGSRQTVKSPDQPAQSAANRSERRYLSDKEAFDEFRREYFSRPDP